MKLTHLRILNFRSCRDISLELGWMHVLVGANNSGKSAVLRALAGESPDAPQSLLVADGEACFPKKWEMDLKGEIPDTDTLVAEAKREFGLSDDTGKPLIARYVARKLTSRNPPVVPPSIKSIIEKAVSVAWKKSCLQVPSSPALDKPVDPNGTGVA